MKRSSWIILSWLALISTAQSASFDCLRASTQIEKMICDTPALSKHDESMKSVYNSLLKQAPNPAWIKNQQREWLVNIRNRCADSTCLMHEYENRLAILEADARSLQTNNEANVCGVIAGYINRGTLSSLSEHTSELPKNEAPRSELGDILNSQHVESYWSVDLNHDGIPDHILVTSEGNAGWNYTYILSGSKGATIIELGDDGAGYADVLSLGGHHYVYSSKLFTIDKNGKLLHKCEFVPSGEPELQIVFGKENPMCSEIKSAFRQDTFHMFVIPVDEESGFKRPAFSQTHKLEPLPEGERSILDGLAKVDVDNDGQLDNVVRIESAYKGSLPCSATTIAVTNQSRTDIPNTEVNKILLEQLGGYRCSPSLEAIVHRGVTYIHLLDSENNFYRINHTKAEKVCAFLTKQRVNAKTLSED